KGGRVPLRSHSHRRAPAAGQLLLFDPLESPHRNEAVTAPGTSLTPINSRDESDPRVHTLFDPEPWSALSFPTDRPTAVEPFGDYAISGVAPEQSMSELHANEVPDGTQSDTSID